MPRFFPRLQKRYCALLFVGSLLLPVFQNPASSQEKPPTRSTSTIQTKRNSDSKETDDARSNAILLAQGLTNKLLGFTDARTKAIAIARIARQFWTVDEAFARTLFDKSLQVTKPANSNDARNLTLARRFVINLIASKDPEWAQRLIDAATDNDSGSDVKTKSSLEVATAMSLIEENDAKNAAEFGQRSMADQLQPQVHVEFLLRLRKINEPAADQLFLQGLSYFARATKVDVKGFHSFGLYLFTSPDLLDSDKYAITLVDKILVPNITAQRPGAPDALVRAYLSTAGTVLWRAIEDPEQHKFSYALGYLLIPRAKSIAPDLAARLEAAMSAVSSQVPANLTTDAAYKYITAAPLTAEESLSRAEQKPDQYSKDIAYFDITASALRKDDFKLARTANARISDLEVSRKLTQLIDFSEASNLIRLNPSEAANAQKISERLDQGIEKVMLLLSIAKAREKTREVELSEEAVDLALKAVASVGDSRRPFLILLAAAQLASLRSSAAQVVLGNAIKDFNRFEAKELSEVDWSTPVQLGPLSHSFSITVNHSDLGFGPAFRKALESDPEAGLARADELKNETLRASSYVEIVTITLEKPTKNRSLRASSMSEPAKP